MHGIRQIGPTNTRVIHLCGQAFIGLEANGAWNIVLLGGPTGGVDQHDGILADVLGVQCAGEELVVGAMNGITALECHHVFAVGEAGSDLRWRFAGEDTLRKLQALNQAPEIETTALCGDHAHRRVL